jgi:ketosteroid isomerase-like protein
MTAMPKLSTEQVQAEVQRYWSAFTNKDAEQLMQFYSCEATVFGSATARPEPGRLAAARREREYFHSKSALRAQVGLIDVVLLGDTAAVASYTFQFHANRAGALQTENVEEDIRNGRATQVYAFDPEGRLQIVHEHFSTVAGNRT